MQQRARHAVDIVATRLGRSANWVAAALEAIADAMASIGINRSSTNSHVPRLVGLLQHCSTEVAASSSAQHSDDQASYAEMICSVADFTLKLAESTLVNARALTNDVVALLRSWAVDPESIVRLAGRPEWLLDGWEQICLLWEVAEGDAARRAALIEMVQLVPVLPREAREWSALLLEAEISARLRRLIPLNQDWRTGATVFDRIARNEHMRALACYGDVEASNQLTRQYPNSPVKLCTRYARICSTRMTGRSGKSPRCWTSPRKIRCYGRYWTRSGLAWHP
jgi:hypothetical protein